MPIILRTDCASDQRRTALMAAEFAVHGCDLQEPKRSLRPVVRNLPRDHPERPIESKRGGEIHTSRSGVPPLRTAGFAGTLG